MPRIDYRSVGLTLKLAGAWNADDGNRGTIVCTLELSSIADSSVSIAPDVMLPAFVRLKIEQHLLVQSGQAVWALSNTLPVPGDEMGTVTAGIARLRLTRLPAPPDDVLPESPPQTQSRQPQRARTQTDLFELVCTGQQLAAIDLDSITDGDPTDSALLERLGELGTARLLNRTLSTADLRETCRVSPTAMVPCVRDVTVGVGGKVTPSANYHSIGVIGEISGRWRGGDAHYADLRAKIEASTIGRSAVKQASGVYLPAFANFSLEQRVGAVTGMPVWTMSSDLPVPADKDATTSVVFVRLRPTWLPGPAKAEPVEEPASGVPASASEKDRQPAKLQLDLFHLTCTDEQLAAVEFDKMTVDDPAPAAMLERLRSHGSAALLARVEDTVDLRRGLDLSHGSTVPRVRDMTISGGTTRPSVEYKDIGLNVNLSGSWLPGSPPWAATDCSVQLSTDAPSHVRLASGVTLPISISLSVRQKQLFESGRSVWLITNTLPQPDDPQSMVNVEILRLAVTRMGGTEAGKMPAPRRI